LLQGRSFEREREVRKHIGDYTLFLTGIFPEYVARLPRRGLRLDSMIDYVQAGKESYRIVAAFDPARIATERGCGRLEWRVLDWNKPAIQFYRKLGALPMNEWTKYRLSGDALKKLGSFETVMF
jgi:hypothetical protein